MGRIILRTILSILFSLIFVSAAYAQTCVECHKKTTLSIGNVWPAEAPRITKEDLKAMLGNPDWIIIDVRHGKDWTDSNLKIKGALREDPDAVDSWAKKYSKEKNLVLYCA